MGWTAYLRVVDCASGVKLANVQAKLLLNGKQGTTDSDGLVRLGDNLIDNTVGSVQVSLDLTGYQSTTVTVAYRDAGAGGPALPPDEMCLVKIGVQPPPPDPGSTRAPTFYELMPETAKFGHPGSIVARWRSPDQYDVWHLQWKDKAYPNRPEHWSAIELKTRLSTEFSYRAAGTVAGITYTFAVQGCRHSNLGTDRCSPYSPNIDVLMRNTHSLREWLGDAQLNPGIRSLGNQTYGRGFRAMMGI